MVRCSRCAREKDMADETVSRSKSSLYESTTRKIIAMIEAGADTYKAPWHVPAGKAVHPINAATHAEYRGINILTLWMDAIGRGYPSSQWASYRQWQQMGAQVRQGERGCAIVFYKRVETSASEEEDHDQEGRLRFVARRSWVFNATQVDGYEPAPEEKRPDLCERIGEVEAFVSALNAQISHGFPMACYRRTNDSIEMPNRNWFAGTPTSSSTESYYSVLLHELTHWSGAPHRLNRVFGKRFGDQAYAMEELVAELGAAFLCAAFGISTEPRPDHAAYVASWLEVLDKDPKAIFTAASKAQEAFEHLAYLATKVDL